MSMTILHIVTDTEMGGCERLSLDLAQWLKRQGYRQYAWVLSGQNGPVPDAFRHTGVALIGNGSSPRGRLALAMAARRLCRQHRIDGVVSHAFGIHALIALGARLGGASAFLALAGNPPPVESAARLAALLYVQFGRPFTRCHIAPSDYVAEAMRRVYRLPTSSVRVIPNWLRDDLVTQPLRERPTPFVFGCIARLDPIKDHRTLLSAFAQLDGTVELRLIGDGVLRDEIHQLARELGIESRVQFLGARSDIPEQLAAMDAFAFATTRDEGFGIVLAEAMASGLPVVCSNIGPCAEVTADAALLVAPADADAMAAGMRRLMTEPALRQQLAQAGVARARSRYSIEAAGPQIIDALSCS